jgi:diguanylate cyclase (GGDEF)-like protein
MRRSGPGTIEPRIATVRGGRGVFATATNRVQVRQRGIRGWAIWSAPRPARAMALTVDAVALILGVAAIAFRLDRPQIVLAPLLICAAVAIEGARRVERARHSTGTLHKDLQSAWSLAAALLLPAGVAVVAAVAMYAWWRFRAGRCRPFAWVFSCSMTLLAVLAAGTVYRITESGLHDVPAIGGLSSTLGVLAAAVAYEIVDVALCGALILLLSPGTSRVEAFGDRTTAAIDAAALTFGGLVSILALYEPWAMLLALPGVVLLQRVLLVDQLAAEARTDTKTGLSVAGWWHERASAELAVAQARGTSLAILVADLDHFKRINDAYGHLVGDEVLRAVGDAFAAGVRGKDLAGRFGGEEFVLALPDTDADRAAAVAERLRGRIATLQVPSRVEVPDAEPVRGLTVSIGAAVYPDHADTLDSLLRVADTALYAAKAAGRNRISVAGSPAVGPTSRGADTPVDSDAS